MTVFLESPWPALLLTLLTIAGLVVALVQTGKVKILWAILAVAIIGGGMLLMERNVVTEREAVENALNETAATLLLNDTAKSLARFTTDSPRRAEIAAVISRVRFRDARVTGDLEIQLHDQTTPPTATAKFIGRADVQEAHGTIGPETAILRFKVTLHRPSDQWLIHDLEYTDVMGAGKR